MFWKWELDCVLHGWWDWEFKCIEVFCLLVPNMAPFNYSWSWLLVCLWIKTMAVWCKWPVFKITTKILAASQQKNKYFTPSGNKNSEHMNMQILSIVHSVSWDFECRGSKRLEKKERNQTGCAHFSPFFLSFSQNKFVSSGSLETVEILKVQFKVRGRRDCCRCAICCCRAICVCACTHTHTDSVCTLREDSFSPMSLLETCLTCSGASHT